MFIIIQKKTGDGVNALDYPGDPKYFTETERHPTLSNKWITKVGNKKTLTSLNSEVDYELVEYIESVRPEDERIWRNSELLKTDYFMMLPDYPHKTALKTYRKLLRDYPATEKFPDGDRPTL